MCEINKKCKESKSNTRNMSTKPSCNSQAIALELQENTRFDVL